MLGSLGAGHPLLKVEELWSPLLSKDTLKEASGPWPPALSQFQWTQECPFSAKSFPEKTQVKPKPAAMWAVT